MTELEIAEAELNEATAAYDKAEGAFWSFYKDQVINPKPATPELDDHVRQLISDRNRLRAEFHRALAKHSDAKLAKGAA